MSREEKQKIIDQKKNCQQQNNQTLSQPGTAPTCDSTQVDTKIPHAVTTHNAPASVTPSEVTVTTAPSHSQAQRFLAQAQQQTPKTIVVNGVTYYANITKVSTAFMNPRPPTAIVVP